MPTPSTLRILLIDPNEVNYVITRRLLSELGGGYELAWVDSFEDGLRSFQRHDYDLALIDEEVDNAQGNELLRQMARSQRSMPVLILTEGVDGGSDQEALDLGAAGWLDKTRLNARELERAVRLALLRERYVHDLREHNDELLGLHRLTTLALEGTDVPSLPQAAAEELSLATGFPIVCFESYDETTGLLTCVASQGLPEDAVGRSQLAAHSLGHDAVAHGRPQLEMGFGPGSAYLHARQIGTWMALPVRSHGRVVGLVTLAQTDSGPVDSTQIHRATGLIDHLGRLCERFGEFGPDQTLPAARREPVASADIEGEILDPVQEIGPALSMLRGELAQRGVLVRLRDFGGSRWVRRGTTPWIRRYGRLLIGSLLRALEPSRADVRILPEGEARPEHLLVEISVEELDAPRSSPADEHDALAKQLCASRANVLRRLAERLGVRMTIAQDASRALRASLEFPLPKPRHE